MWALDHTPLALMMLTQKVSPVGLASFILFLVIVRGIASESYVRVGRNHEYLVNATVFPDVSLALCAANCQSENLYSVFRYFWRERLCITQGGWHTDLADMMHDKRDNEMVYVTANLLDKGRFPCEADIELNTYRLFPIHLCSAVLSSVQFQTFILSRKIKYLKY